MMLRNAPLSGQDGGIYSSDLGLRKIRIFLQRGLDRQNYSRVADLPVGQIKQPVRQQIAGWIERFAKPIAVVHNRMLLTQPV
jgi:hypothetical protein